MSEHKSMTQEELDTIRKRSDAATPGPWVSEDGGYDVCLGYKPSHIRIGWWDGDREQDLDADNRRVCELSDGEYNSYKNKKEMQANAEFIAHSRIEYNGIYEKFFVRCPKCRMSGPLVEDKHAAAEAWNSLPRRHEITPNSVDCQGCPERRYRSHNHD